MAAARLGLTYCQKGPYQKGRLFGIGAIEPCHDATKLFLVDLLPPFGYVGQEPILNDKLWAFFGSAGNHPDPLTRYGIFAKTTG